MSRPWPFGTVLRLIVEDAPKSYNDAVHYATARVMVISDREVSNVFGVSLVKTTRLDAGDVNRYWARNRWTPVDE